MPRRLIAALAVALLLSLAEAAEAAPTVAVPAMAGDVATFALSGDAVIVARRPPGGRLLIERYDAAGRRTVLLRTRLNDADDEVQLAASPEAVAVSLSTDGDDAREEARVLIGPAAGPLREVARCEVSLFGLFVAVDGPRIAWSDGGCGEPVDRPRRPTRAAVAIGAVDPAVPVRRLPLEEERLIAGMVLRGGTGLVSVLRPSLFTFIGGELRRLGGDALGPPFARDGDFFLPAAALGDGTTVLLRQSLDDDLGDPGDEPCETEVSTIAAGGQDARPLAVGGCVAETTDDAAFTAGSSVPSLAAADDRVAVIAYARTERQRERGRFGTGPSVREPVILRTVRSDGSDPRIVVRGGRHRGVDAVDGAPGRVAWSQVACGGGTEILTADARPSGAESRLIPTCRADLLTRRAAVRNGAITLRLSCPRGCKGRVTDTSVCKGETNRLYRFGPGTHTLRVRLSRAARRRGRALIRVRAESGPQVTRTIRLRRASRRD